MRGGAKKTSGFTLLELLIASGLLMVLTLPILGMFVTATRLSATSHKITTATFMAQMRIEELIGHRKSEIEALPGASPSPDSADITVKTVEENGFLISADITFDAEGLSTLAEVAVSVFDTDGSSLLCSQTAIIYIEGP